MGAAIAHPLPPGCDAIAHPLPPGCDAIAHPLPPGCDATPTRCHPYGVRFDELIGLWREGERRLARSDASDRAALERVTDALVVELRRRLGGPFATDELAALYSEQGTDWCFDIATRVEPESPAAWDLTTVGGAAFARYAREASDYRGRQAEE